MTIFDLFLNLIFPAPCPICGKLSRATERGEVICRDCYGEIRGINGPCCPSCGRPFPSGVALLHSPDHLCGTCRRRRPYFDKAFTAGAYEGALREAIHLFKYQRHWRLGVWLADRMAALAQQELSGETIDVVVPVPMHWWKHRLRGIWPSQILSARIAHQLKRRHAAQALFRRRWTSPQTDLTAAQRFRNVVEAFAARPRDVTDAGVLLVDDVLTSGATAHACAQALRMAGARTVSVVASARAFLR